MCCSIARNGRDSILNGVWDDVASEPMDRPECPPRGRLAAWGARTGTTMSVRLSGVIPWGRSLDEYRSMLALTDDDLAGIILGCGDGPASFNAEATALGHRVISCDPIYALPAVEIERRVEECYDVVISQVRNNLAGFVWKHFQDPDRLGACRLAAMRRFLADFEKGKREGRYVAAWLPSLSFDDGRFSLAVVSHFLFLYSEQLDLRFHLAALEELLRVADEVRVFPLSDLDGRRSVHVDPVCEYLKHRGFAVEIIAVDYEFQRTENRAGNRMLRIRRADSILGSFPSPARPRC